MKFTEVSHGWSAPEGYTQEQAQQEAGRCLNCPSAPCKKGCPVGVAIPEFIAHIKNGDVQSAKDKIEETNAFGSICGRVCPQENQCQKECVFAKKGNPIKIGNLERFACDNGEDTDVPKPPCGKRVAVVGSGPAGIACAGELAKHGVEVVVFEALHEVGGVLMYGIPEFRLPGETVRSQIDKLRKMGVTIETNVVIGKTLTIAQLRGEFDAVFIGSGAGLPNFMGIEGEMLGGVLSANEFLTRINLMDAERFPECDTPIRLGKDVAVIGGGNVAMDAARSAVRLGANVKILYRRSIADMPARREEVEHALEEGVQIIERVRPARILGDEYGTVTGLEAEDGEVYPANTVIVAIGQRPNPLIARSEKGLEVNEKGGIIVVSAGGLTSINSVYAGGDAVTGAATVILAMGAGREAAKEIMAELDIS